MVTWSLHDRYHLDCCSIRGGPRALSGSVRLLGVVLGSFWGCLGGTDRQIWVYVTVVWVVVQGYTYG